MERNGRDHLHPFHKVAVLAINFGSFSHPLILVLPLPVTDSSHLLASSNNLAWKHLKISIT